MDAVRFGRALGVGARAAAKTLVTAADAATAENPSAKTAGVRANAVPTANAVEGRVVPPAATTRADTARPAARPADSTVTAKAAKTAARTIVGGRNAKEALGRGGKRFGQAALEPVVRLSGVLWLEVSGAFFGIFALGALGGAWRLRGSWHEGRTAREQLVGAAAMFVLFGYFCISNFVRARRRERGE
jgi:hypothetical protein